MACKTYPARVSPHHTPHVYIRGRPWWDDRFSLYGIKVSFWGSGTLKIVIYVENHPQKPKNRLDYYHPLCVWGC